MSDHLSFLAAHVHNLRLADWCALLAVVVSQRIAALAGMWSYALFTRPGTVAHEAAHYVIAFLLGGRPSFPDLLPEREKYGWRIGGVRFSSGLLRNVPIALAPISLLPLGLWWANGHLPHLRVCVASMGIRDGDWRQPAVLAGRENCCADAGTRGDRLVCRLEIRLRY